MQKRLFDDIEEVERKTHPNNVLNDLTGKEWIQETVSVWFQKGLGRDHPHTYYERQHPAPFPYKMVERLLKFFTKSGDVVLDPFSGIGSTIKACGLTNRKCIGIELSKKWANLSKQRLEKELPTFENFDLIIGDSRRVLTNFDDNYFDFIVTSPPYWQILNKPPDHRIKKERLEENLETRYSTDKNDLANISSYNEFLTELNKVFKECYRLLHPKKYMVIVVGDFRNKSEYITYHSDIINLMRKLNFILKGITIFVQNHKKIYPYGYPYDYVPNIHHQYILIFKKV